MPITPSGFVNLTQLDEQVSRAISKLGPEVVRVRYKVGEDWTGDPSINFRIVLTDAASREENLGDVTEKIRRVVVDELRPYEWGLIPYFSFRSQSEQATRSQDLEWI